MKKKSLLLSAAGFLLVPSFLFAGTNFAKSSVGTETAPLVAPAAKGLIVGEHLVFDVYWMGLHVGIGSLEVREILNEGDRRAYHVIAIARTNDTLTKIYPIYDEIHSKIDTEEFYSYGFSKNLKEGRYRADEKVVFNHETQKGIYESFLNKTRKEFDIPPKAQDFLSLFYWFRVQTVLPGQSAHAVISDKGKDYDVELAVLRHEKKELKNRAPLWTLEVEPKTRYKEILYQRGRGWVHFTSDTSRIPVQIRITTPFGPVTGVLRGDFKNV